MEKSTHSLTMKESVQKMCGLKFCSLDIPKRSKQ